MFKVGDTVKILTSFGGSYDGKIGKIVSRNNNMSSPCYLWWKVQVDGWELVPEHFMDRELKKVEEEENE